MASVPDQSKQEDDQEPEMDSDEENALKAKGMAEEMIRNKDYKGARDMISQAIELFPTLDNAFGMLAVCEVLCSAEIEFPSYGIDWYFVLQLPPSTEDAEVKAKCQELANRLKPIKETFAGAKSALEFIQKAETELCDGANRSAFNRKRERERNAFDNSPSKKTRLRSDENSNSKTILSLREKIHKMDVKEIAEKAAVVEEWRKKGYLRKQDVPFHYDTDEDRADRFDKFSQEVVKKYPNFFKESEQHPDYNGISSGDVLADDVLKKALWKALVILVKKVAHTTEDTSDKILENYWCELEGLERFGFDMFILGCRLQALQNYKKINADIKKCLEEQLKEFENFIEKVEKISAEEEEEKLRLSKENEIQLREEVEKLKILMHEKEQLLKLVLNEQNVLGKEISKKREMIARGKEEMKRKGNFLRDLEKVKENLRDELNAYGR